MPQPASLDPSPFYLSAGPVGCLLIHGFTGSTAEMRPMGEHLCAGGYTVSAPLLAGHGTVPDELANTTWQDWYASVLDAYEALRGSCSRVFVGGFSLGSLLAVHLAVEHDVSGLILMSPAFWVRDRRAVLTGLLKHLVRFVPKDLAAENSDLTNPQARQCFWSYDVIPVAAAHQVLLLQRLARTELSRVSVPALVIYAVGDGSIAPHSGPRTYERLGAEDKELLVLQNSGHGLVVDSEREFVFERVAKWVADRFA